MAHRTRLYSSTQLALLRTLRTRQMIARGFTLVELMIVVAIVGILSAVALPNFLQARNAAANGARIGEGLGLAKEYATCAASDINVGSTTPGDANITTTNLDDTGCTDGGTVSIALISGPAGIRCLANQSAAGSTLAKIVIDANGGMTCTFS